MPMSTPSLQDITGLDVVQNENEVLKMVAMSPIERGGEGGPSGYAKAVLNARRLMSHHGEPDLEKHVGKNVLLKIARVNYYYHCPNCNGCL
jgi:hypothetical protein